MGHKMRAKLAKVQEIANKMGVSDDELRQRLVAGTTGRAAEVETARPPERLSFYGKSILLSVLIGMGYVIDQVIRFGMKHAVGILSYVAFCVFMISSKRLLEKRVGTYFIGTGIHLPPANRPAWGSAMFLGWILLALPALGMLLKRVGSH